MHASEIPQFYYSRILPCVQWVAWDFLLRRLPGDCPATTMRMWSAGGVHAWRAAIGPEAALTAPCPRS